MSELINSTAIVWVVLKVLVSAILLIGWFASAKYWDKFTTYIADDTLSGLVICMDFFIMYVVVVYSLFDSARVAQNVCNGVLLIDLFFIGCISIFNFIWIVFDAIMETREKIRIKRKGS